MRKEKRFSLAKRVVGGLSVLVLVVTLAVVAFTGLGFVSGVLLTASVSGVVVPCVVSAGSLVELVSEVFDLVAESLATIIEGVLEFFASLF